MLQKFPGYTAAELLAEPAQRIERWLMLASAEAALQKDTHHG
jgi:hypothetical protein